MRKLLLQVIFGSFVLALVATTSRAQSPGGVSSNLKVWLKAGTGVTGTTNVSNWADQSGNGNNASQGTAANQPSLISSDLNFNPSINFSGSTTIMNMTSPQPDLNTTIFSVAIPNVNTNWRTMFRGSANHHPIIVLQGGNTLGFFDNISGGFKSGGFTWLQNEPALVSVEMRSGDVNYRKNGSQGASITTITLTPAALDFFGNYQGNGQSFGRISETVIYNGAAQLSATDKIRIESYLAVKYGITLAHDYQATDGTVTWNATTNSGYSVNITGIGRDDGTALDQRKSTNASSAAGLTIDQGGAFGADKSFLICGDNGSTGSSTNVPTPYVLRSNRIWRAAVTGSPGAQTISIDLTAIGLVNTGTAANYALLKDTDTDFSSGATVHTTGASIVGSILSFTGVTLVDGNYFSIAASNVPLPGGVAGMVFWVKADAGVTGTTNISQWSDQSGYNNAVQATPAQQPALVNTDLNFHPSVNFGGSSSIMSFTTPPTSLNSTIFTVAVPTINTNWRTMFRGTVTDHPLIIQQGGDNLGYYDADGGGLVNSGFTWLQNESAVVGAELRSGNVNFRKNGTQGGTIGTINLTGLTMDYFGNYQLFNQNFGRISETIIFNTASALSATEKSKIESYLATKYGITLTHDYLSSNAGTIWSITTNAGYTGSVTGIGRDDASGLTQPKSKSANTGSVLTLEKTTPASPFTNDRSFLFASDDAGSLGATTTGVPTAFPAFPMRVTRIWKVQSTNTPGSATVSFDVGTGIYNSGSAASYSLLVSNSTDFSGSVPITGGSLVGGVISFSNVTLNDGSFFTLGLPLVPSPGGIISGLRVWLKANTGVSSDAAGSVPATDLGAVQRWNDQTSLNNNATNTGTPIYNLTSNLINFNPTVFYDGASGHNLAYSVTNQYSLITMSRMEGSQSRRAFSSRIGNALSGYWSGREDVLYLDGNPNLLTGQVATTNPRLYSLTRATSGTYQLFRNGLSINSGGASFNSTFQLGIANGGGFGGEASKMYAAEVIQYDRDLSAAELNRVQSYLAIKYGVTLDQSTPSNYTSSDGTVIWNGTTNASYPNNITGVARDDASTLDQRQSQSVNAKSILTLNHGGAFATDKGFLIVGNDNSLPRPTQVGAHPSYPYRVTRIWRSQVTGTPGAVNVSFDLSVGIYNTGVATDYALLVKNANTDFSTGASAITTGAVFNGSVITFTNVTFTNGDFFTLALPNVPGPGGVVGNMQIWLKANTGVVGGATASQWTDQSGNGFNVTQATAGNQPSILSSRVNFNPSLQFNGSSSSLSLTGGILGTSTYTDANVFVVSRTNTVSNSSVLFETTSGAGQFNAHLPWGDRNAYWDAGNTGTNRVSANWGGTVNTPYVWGMAASTSPMPSGGLQDLYRNGLRINNDLTMGTYTGNNSNLFIGSGNGTNFFNGEISEVVVYTGAITALQLQQIQSYLALKYGVTLSQTTPQDYVSSSGSVIYHSTTTHSGYSRDVAGIGRDDNSALDQRKSKSVNTTPSDIVSFANTDFTTPGAFGTNLQYLVWGNNGLPVSADITASGYTHNGAAIVRQTSRVWSTDKTGAPAGNAIVEVDMSLVYGPTGFGTNNNADVRLLVDNDAIFGNASPGEHAYSLTSVAGGKIYFQVPYTDIQSGQGFMTLGSVNAATAPLFAPSPGGIAVDLRLWLRADLGVAGGATVSSWTDKSPNGFVANQGTAANQPTVLSNRLNFNPAISFDGTNDDLSITGGVLGTNTYTDVYAYTVNRTNVVQSSKLLSEGTQAGSQFGAYTPWSDNNIYWDAGDAGATNRLQIAWGGTVGTPYLWTLGGSTTSTPSGVRQDISRNTLRIASDATMSAFTGNNSNLYVGSQTSTNFYNGEVSEVAVITGTMTTSQQQRVHSYLAIKYGITINQTTAQNYFSSLNAVVFHSTTTHALYRNDIAGIGRDDNSLLDQRKSKSINTPSDIITMADGNFGTPTAFAADQQFLLWGHNGLPYAADAAFATITHNGAVITKRLARVWSTDKTGSPSSNVVIEYNMAVIGGPSGVGTNANADVRLLVDNDGTFGNGSAGEVTVAPDPGFGATGGTIYFSVPFSSIPAGQGFITVGSVNSATAPLTNSLPGGVAEPMRLWLEANAGVTGATNASAWADQSVNAFNATQATGANQPAILTNRLNFNPSIQFNGSNMNMSVTGGILSSNSYSNLTVFEIARTNAVSSSQSFAENVSGGIVAAYTPWSDNNVYWDAGNSTVNRVNTAWGGSINTPYLWTFGANASTPSQNIYRNGLTIASDATMGSFNGNGSNFFVGSGVNTNYYNGEVSELIIYNASLTAAEQQRIQSYLGIKYGITIDQSTPTNYVTADATVIWNGTTNSTYKSDIAGIGRDDASGLDQRKSQSVNLKSLITMDRGGAFTNNKEFVVWGSDNGTLALTTAGTLPPFYPYRLTRTWKMQVSGSPGPISIAFDLSQGIYNSGNAANYQLLMKVGDTDFSTGSTNLAGTLVGNILTFSGITPLDGQFFSLGLANFPAPGGVVPNMQFWVKADVGVTGTSNVSVWADQSGVGNNASQGTVSQQPALISSDINYNPSINFSGATTIMTLSQPPANLNSTIFTVGVPVVNTNWRTMFRGAVSDHPIIIQTGGTTLGYYDGDVGTFKSGGFTWLQNEVATVALEMRAGNVNFRKNGAQGAAIGTINLAGLNLDYYGNYQGGSQNFGRVGETVIYNSGTALTATEKNRIETYFGIKYGLTLSHDYLASDASVIWNSTTNATYHHDVAAIGRDDNSGLSQKQSGSSNSGNILAISNGSGALAADNASNAHTFGADKSFFTWGHNNLNAAGSHVSDFGTSTNGDVIKTRFARAWLATETGTVGTVHLRFDMSAVKGVGGVAGNNDLSKVRLLVDADGVFASGAFSVSPTSFNNATAIVEFEYDFVPATGFYFSIGSTDLTVAPLPVQLLTFEARATDDNVVLTWLTASELNSDYFGVESSPDGELWTEIKRVKGKGTVTTETNYQTTDDSPLMGKSYYRLAQVDLDGTKRYSTVRTVEFKGTGIRLYPNPTVKRQVTLDVPAASSTVVISVMNILGQEVYNRTLSGLEPRKQSFLIDLGEVKAGEYLVRVVNGPDVFYRKLIVE